MVVLSTKTKERSSRFLLCIFQNIFSYHWNTIVYSQIKVWSNPLHLSPRLFYNILLYSLLPNLNIEMLSGYKISFLLNWNISCWLIRDCIVSHYGTEKKQFSTFPQPSDNEDKCVNGLIDWRNGKHNRNIQNKRIRISKLKKQDA